MERPQCAVPAQAMAAGCGGKSLLSFSPCALTLPKKKQKTSLKQKTGSKGKGRKETFWSEKDGISALERLHDHHQFEMLEPEWVATVNLNNFTHLSHHKLHSGVQQPKSRLHDWAALLLYSKYFYIVNTYSIACQKTVTFHVFFKIHS